MVVGFTTTCAISAYHHWSCEFEPRSWRGVNSWYFDEWKKSGSYDFAITKQIPGFHLEPYELQMVNMKTKKDFVSHWAVYSCTMLDFFSYMLDRLKPRASTFRGPPANEGVYYF